MRGAGLLLAASVRHPETGARLATATFTADGHELLLWMWAHHTRDRWYRPTELLTWTIMQRAMRGGCETLDFMGRGDFKARLGATLDESKVRWVRSRYRWLAAARDAAERGYRWQQAVRGRLGRRRLPAEPAERGTDDERGADGGRRGDAR
jgi:hypothetical protein